MNFTIEKTIILQSLQKLNNILSINSENSIINNIFLKTKNKYLFLISTNLETELLSKIPCIKIDKHGEIIVPGRKFLNIIRSFPINAIINISKYKKKIKISYKNIYFILVISNAKKFPTFETEKNTIDIDVPQKKFQNIIYNTQFSIAKQDIRHYLNGMCLEINENKISAITTDGYRMSISYIYIKKSKLNHSIIIPRKTIIEIIKILKDNTMQFKIIIGRKIFQMHTDQYILSSKLIDHEFPNYKSLIITNFDKTIKINRIQLKESLMRASILAYKKTPGVKLSLGHKECIITTQNEYDEKIKEKFLIDYDGKIIELTININYILDIIHVIEDDFITILLSNLTNSIYIKNIEKSHSFYIIMPLII